MLLGNDTPFAAIGFDNKHRDGMSVAVVAVRASYHLSARGGLQLANAQEVALNHGAALADPRVDGGKRNIAEGCEVRAIDGPTALFGVGHKHKNPFEIFRNGGRMRYDVPSDRTGPGKDPGKLEDAA